MPFVVTNCRIVIKLTILLFCDRQHVLTLKSSQQLGMDKCIIIWRWEMFIYKSHILDNLNLFTNEPCLLLCSIGISREATPACETRPQSCRYS